MNDESQDCERTTLSESSVVLVEACTCGIIHLTLGAISLRFHPEAARSLCLTLNDALEKVGAIEGTQLPNMAMSNGSPRGSA